MNQNTIDATQIYQNLWQGSYPGGLEDKVQEQFDVIVLCAAGLQPLDSRFPGVEVLKVPLHDWDPPYDGTYERAEQMGLWVAKEFAAGKRILTTCAAGRNRSGLVNALALRQITGWSGAECVRVIQSLRHAALTNEAFEKYLAAMPGIPA